MTEKLQTINSEKKQEARQNVASIVDTFPETLLCLCPSTLSLPFSSFLHRFGELVYQVPC